MVKYLIPGFIHWIEFFAFLLGKQRSCRTMSRNGNIYSYKEHLPTYQKFELLLCARLAVCCNGYKQHRAEFSYAVPCRLFKNVIEEEVPPCLTELVSLEISRSLLWFSNSPESLKHLHRRPRVSPYNYGVRDLEAHHRCFLRSTNKETEARE